MFLRTTQQGTRKGFQIQSCRRPNEDFYTSPEAGGNGVRTGVILNAGVCVPPERRRQKPCKAVTAKA